MKNKFQDDYPLSARSESDENIEQRIEKYRKAWQEGNLKIDSQRLAEKIIELELQIDKAVHSPSPYTIRNRQ